MKSICGKKKDQRIIDMKREEEAEANSIKKKIKEFFQKFDTKIDELKKMKNNIRNENHQSINQRLLEKKCFVTTPFLTYMNLKNEMEIAKLHYIQAKTLIEKNIVFLELEKKTKEFLNYLDFEEEENKLDPAIFQWFQSLNFFSSNDWINELIKNDKYTFQRANYAKLTTNILNKEFKFLDNLIESSEKKLKDDFKIRNEIDELDKHYCCKKIKNESEIIFIKHNAEHINTNDEKVFQEKSTKFRSTKDEQEKPDLIKKQISSNTTKNLNLNNFDDKKYEDIGFKNLGNTCYMNSIMQCLKNSNSLIDYIGSLSSSELLDNTEYNSQILIHDFINLLKQIRDPPKSKVIDPIEFKEKIGQINNKFSGTSQEDAHEVLLEILKSLDKDLTKKSFISKNFCLELENIIECQKCKTQSISYEKNFTLPLPLIDLTQAPLKFDDGLKNIFMTKHLKRTCQKCNEKTQTTISRKISYLPEMLIIQLQRMDMNQRKIKRLIEYPENNLNLSPFLSQKSNIEKTLYSLSVICNHSGETIQSGHYYTYAKNPYIKKWHIFNDEKVEDLKLANSPLVNENGYILFYEKNK